MKREFLQTIGLTAFIALGVALASKVFGFSYVEWSFFIGLVISTTLFVFNSTSEVVSKSARLDTGNGQIEEQSGLGKVLSRKSVFYGAFLYTIIGFVLALNSFLA